MIIQLVNRTRIPWMVWAILLLLGCNLEIASAGGAATATSTPSGSTTAGITSAGVTLEISAIQETPTNEPPPDPTSSSTYTVVHVMRPSDPSGTTRYITDPLTRDYAPQKKAPSGSDIFQNNRYERPYTADAMEYLSDVDLIRVEMKIASPWIYITIEFSSLRAEGIGRTVYGAEFDLDKDGRGEVLVWGVSPSSATWTTNGVEVWQDTNGDVGGLNPQKSDSPIASANGYDQKVFADGQGADPDLAWIRQINGVPKVQLAFKYSLLGSAAQFLWNGLADTGIRRSDWFDYNDHFTATEAGSPLPVQTDLYPLKAVWGMDNTCRDAYGFVPTGLEAGLCQYYGNISGVVGWDIDHNGVLDATELSISMIAGDTVTLGQGACPSAGYKTAVTDSQGKYAFPDLPIGIFCVGLIHTIPVPLSIPPVSVNLTPGQNRIVDFVIPW